MTTMGMAMWYCSPPTQALWAETSINVEAAEQVFKTSMHKIETGRRSRGGIQLEKSLMIALIALKARRYIWDEHVMTIHKSTFNAFSPPVQTNSDPLLIETDEGDDRNDFDDDSAFPTEEVGECMSEPDVNRKRPSSSSDSESESEEELDSDFILTTPASPQKRYRRDHTIKKNSKTDSDNGDEDFCNPAITQLVTSFDNLLSSQIQVQSDTFCNLNSNHDNTHVTFTPLQSCTNLSMAKSCSLTVSTSSSVSTDTGFRESSTYYVL